jgi:hypothetical protein
MFFGIRIALRQKKWSSPMFLNIFCLLFSIVALSSEDFPIRENFYSPKGKEQVVSFDGIFLTEFRSLDKVSDLSLEDREQFKEYRILPTLKYLFGPLTRREIGNPQRGIELQVDWTSATLLKNRVAVKYRYQAVWILDARVKNGFQIPVPYDAEDLFTPNWKRCTDSHPDHQTNYYYWYYWDPARSGCDHTQLDLYQTVEVELGFQTENQKISYPEYSKIAQSGIEAKALQMTFAFGYVDDPTSPNPDFDFDSGMQAYRAFLNQARIALPSLVETPILQREYLGASNPNLVIGHRFTGTLKGIPIKVNIVSSAGIDQMELFAKSFAHDHDGFFAWLGHSRVGSGFDADRFSSMLIRNPSYYSLTNNYQLVYWGGCNSYSYYTLPFFDLKAKASNGADSKGTLGLDIIANGLPSYFHLNSINAEILLRNLLSWESRPSYQKILNEIESAAGAYGIDVLVAVLGDEDNPK